MDSSIARFAITQSINHDEIVTIDYDATAAIDLSVASEGSVDVTQTHGVTEYWGTDEGGHNWRVHMCCHKEEADPDTGACECGQATGVACEWTGPINETVIVEWMTEYLRASHEAAGGGGGVWPHDGSLRLRVERSCADRLASDDQDED